MRPYRLIAAVLFAFCVFGMARAQSAGGVGEEADVRRVVQHEIEGWSRFDAAQIASCYTADTTWQNPFGVRIHGRADLQKFLTSLFQRPGYRSAKDTTAPRITEVHMLSPTSAAVWSEEKSAGQIDDATGKAMAPRYSHYLEVLTKKDGTWRISDSIIMDEYPRP